jgi:hypothetical protein
MNSASNMIAKWYQNPIRAEARQDLAMPTASVGAPPVRETSCPPIARTRRQVLRRVVEPRPLT